MRRLASGAIKLLFSFGFVEDVFQLPAFPSGPLLCSDAGIKGLHCEALPLCGMVEVVDAAAKDPVDGLLPRLGGAAVLAFQQGSEIIVDGEGGAHIMMLAGKAS